MMMSMGPLARHVVDAAIVLQAMAGPDGRDFTCIQTEPPDYLASIDAGVEGMRFAWTDDFGFTEMYAQAESPRVIAAVREAPRLRHHRGHGGADRGGVGRLLPRLPRQFLPLPDRRPTPRSRPTPEAWASRARHPQAQLRPVPGGARRPRPDPERHHPVGSPGRSRSGTTRGRPEERPSRPTARSRPSTRATRTCSTGSVSRPRRCRAGSSRAADGAAAHRSPRQRDHHLPRRQCVPAARSRNSSTRRSPDPDFRGQCASVRRRRMRSAVGGCELNRFANSTFRPASGLTM